MPGVYTFTRPMPMACYNVLPDACHNLLLYVSVPLYQMSELEINERLYVAALYLYH